MDDIRKKFEHSNNLDYAMFDRFVLLFDGNKKEILKYIFSNGSHILAYPDAVQDSFTKALMRLFSVDDNGIKEYYKALVDF